MKEIDVMNYFEIGESAYKQEYDSMTEIYVGGRAGRDHYQRTCGNSPPSPYNNVAKLYLDANPVMTVEDLLGEQFSDFISDHVKCIDVSGIIQLSKAPEGAVDAVQRCVERIVEQFNPKECPEKYLQYIIFIGDECNGQKKIHVRIFFIGSYQMGDCDLFETADTDRDGICLSSIFLLDLDIRGDTLSDRFYSILKDHDDVSFVTLEHARYQHLVM